MMYNELVEHLFFHPVHVGDLSLNQPQVVHVHINQNHGAVIIDFYLHYSLDGSILQACFRAKGSPYLIAAMEWLSRRMQNMNIKKSEPLHYETLVRELAMPVSAYPLALLVDGIYQQSAAKVECELREE